MSEFWKRSLNEAISARYKKKREISYDGNAMMRRNCLEKDSFRGCFNESRPRGRRRWTEDIVHCLYVDINIALTVTGGGPTE